MIAGHHRTPNTHRAREGPHLGARRRYRPHGGSIWLREDDPTLHRACRDLIRDLTDTTVTPPPPAVLAAAAFLRHALAGLDSPT